MRLNCFLNPAHPTPPAGQLQLYVRGDQPFARPLAELVYLQADVNYTWLYWQDGQRQLISRTLKHYATHLPAPWFVRLHRNCLVNLYYLHRLEYTSMRKGGRVYLRTGEELLVSRRQLPVAKDLIELRC